MKKLQKFLMMTVLVAMLIGMVSVASSAAATMTPSQTFAVYDGETNPSVSGGTQKCSYSLLSKGGNKYYEIDFIDSGANANFGGNNKDFLGKGDYIVMEFDFMAEDWSTVKSILIGWNSRNHNGGALNDMHFSFGNDNGKPKISANPLNGSIVLSDSKPGQWHHFTMVVQIGGEHATKKSGVLTAVKGQDAVEAYAYIDGQLFAKNLIGDGKEFWSTDTTYFQSLRLTASGGNQRLCMDNIRVLQYESNRDLREFFKYREKNGGAFPDINAVSYPFLAYDEDYDYPLGTPNCKVVELNGTETQFDRFEKACKYAASSSGSKVVLLADIDGAVVKYPVKVDRAGYNLEYTVSSNLRVEEEAIVNPITGALSNEISFIKKTKYAYYQWKIDHTGNVFDPRGYTPIAVGDAIVYDGDAVGKSYYRDGVLYTFTGEWYVDGTLITYVPVYAANSYYTLTPTITTAEVYAIIESADGTTTYALTEEEVATVLAEASKDSVITLVRDITLNAPLTVKTRITLDLAGKTLTVNGTQTAAISLENTATGTVITSSEAGAKIVASGAAFDAACGFTFEGENIVVSAAQLLNANASVYGMVIDGGVFLLNGNSVLLLSDAASLNAEIDAVIVASNVIPLIDPAKSYDITLGGTLAGVKILGSETSTVTLNEGLLLSEASAFVEVALPQGVSFADASLIIAAKTTSGDNGAETKYVVADAEDAVLIAWEADAREYVMPGEKVAYPYSDYYDAKKFYTLSGKYSFDVFGQTVVGDVADAAWVGQCVNVAPIYDSTAFIVVAVKPDGTCVPYTGSANLSSLLSSSTYESGTKFAIGQKNMILEGLSITKDYVLDLNGYALSVLGTNTIAGAKLKIFSSVAGASLYSDAAQAFLATNGTLEIDGENLAYLGGTLVNLDSASSLTICGGVYIVNDDALFYKTAIGALVSVTDISANKELFDAENGYAWTAVEEYITIGGLNCAITAKYELKVEEDLEA